MMFCALMLCPMMTLCPVIFCPLMFCATFVYALLKKMCMRKQFQTGDFWPFFMENKQTGTLTNSIMTL